MMADLRATNRAMFWRIIRRLLGANRGRVLVILLALGAGAAITAALLNLQVDAKRRLTSEFLAFGSNVIVAPRNAPDRTAESTTLEETLLDQVPATNEGNEVVRTGFLYLVANVTAFSSNTNSDAAKRETPVVVTGGAQQQMLDSSPTAPAILTDGLPYCNLGARVASQLHVKMHDKLGLLNGKPKETCSVWYVFPYGGRA